MNKYSFSDRHIGPREHDIKSIMKLVGVKSIDELIDQTKQAAEKGIEAIKRILDDGVKRGKILPEKNEMQNPIIISSYKVIEITFSEVMEEEPLP